jgi:hypothetical protein
VLTDLLKAEGFPVTEAKAAKDAAQIAFKAISDLEDEVRDLHRAIETHFDTDLNEAKKAEVKKPGTALALKAGTAVALTPQAEKKIVTKVISNAEDDMPHEYRYKSYDVLDDKTVHWVTQQTSPKESAAVAQTLVRMLRKAGVKGWTVKVVIRDDYIGDKTKWHAKLKS